MSGMIIRRLFWSLFLVVVPASSFAADNSCSLEANEEIVLDLLNTAVTVQVGSHKVLVPEWLRNLEFEVSSGRGQFAFRLDGEGRSSKSEPGSDGRQDWAGVRSMIFTDDVEVGEESEVFLVSRDCVLGSISVSYISMKDLNASPDESNIVLLRFNGGASALLFGEALDEYLEALRRMNLDTAM